MPLRTENEESSCRTDTLCLGSYLLLVLLVKLGEGPACLQKLGVIGIREAVSLGNQLLVDAHFLHLRLCHIHGVTAEHNIGASSCHIRRYRDGTALSCLRYYLRLTLVMLCIEDVVGDTPAL